MAYYPSIAYDPVYEAQRQAWENIRATWDQNSPALRAGIMDYMTGASGPESGAQAARNILQAAQAVVPSLPAESQLNNLIRTLTPYGQADTQIEGGYRGFGIESESPSSSWLPDLFAKPEQAWDQSMGPQRSLFSTDELLQGYRDYAAKNPRWAAMYSPEKAFQEIGYTQRPDGYWNAPPQGYYPAWQSGDYGSVAEFLGDVMRYGGLALGAANLGNLMINGTGLFAPGFDVMSATGVETPLSNAALESLTTLGERAANAGLVSGGATAADLTSLLESGVHPVDTGGVQASTVTPTAPSNAQLLSELGLPQSLQMSVDPTLAGQGIQTLMELPASAAASTLAGDFVGASAAAAAGAAPFLQGVSQVALPGIQMGPLQPGDTIPGEPSVDPRTVTPTPPTNPTLSAGTGAAAQLAKKLFNVDLTDDEANLILKGVGAIAGAGAGIISGEAQKDLAQQQLDMGKPYRDRLASLYADPQGWIAANVTPVAEQMADIRGRAWSSQVGNPTQNKGAMIATDQDLAALGLQSLNAEKGTLGSLGGLSRVSPDTAFGNMSAGTAAQYNAVTGGLGAILGGLTGTKAPTDDELISKILAQIQQGGGGLYVLPGATGRV